MKEYTVVNILDMPEAIGEENLNVILSDLKSLEKGSRKLIKQSIFSY